MADKYGREPWDIIHKTWPKKEDGKWVFKSLCGTKIPQTNPYSKSSCRWKEVTCKRCLSKRG